MKKRIMSILLILVIVLGMFSTVFADNYDITNKTTTESIKLNDLLFNISKFFEVVENQEDYIIEWYNKNYNLKEVQDRFDADENTTMYKAVAGLTPWTYEEELVAVTKESIVGHWKEVGIYTVDGIHKDRTSPIYFEYTYFSNGTFVMASNFDNHYDYSSSTGTYEVINRKVISVINGVQFTKDEDHIKISKDGTKLYMFTYIDGSAHVFLRQ